MPLSVFYLDLAGTLTEIAPGAVLEGPADSVDLYVASPDPEGNPQNPTIFEQTSRGVYTASAGTDTDYSPGNGTLVLNDEKFRLWKWRLKVNAAQHWLLANFPGNKWGSEIQFEYRKAGPPALAYIPATSEPTINYGDNPVAFAPLAKADGMDYVRIWTDLLASYGGIDEWAAAGLKPVVTTTFKEGNWTLAQSCAPALYANNLATTAQRLRNASIVQFWNEAQFGWYYPSNVTRPRLDNPNTPPDISGLKHIFNEYYKPLSQAIGRGRMAGPSVLPHYQGKEWLQMLVDAGFFDPSYTSYADFHLYFGRWASRQEVIDGVGACKAILPAGIKLISSEFGKDINDTLKVKDAQGRDTSELDYTTGNLQEIYATYATLGFTVMAHFMGGSMSKFADHTKGIYSRTGQRINDDVRACVRKVGAKVQQVAEQS